MIPKILNGELYELFLLVSCRFWLLPHFRLWWIDLSALRSLQCKEQPVGKEWIIYFNQG